MKYFLEEPDKGWISRDWLLRVIESFGRDADNPYTKDPLKAIQCETWEIASDVHTLLRHYGWYSNKTLDITEHQFVG